MAESHIMSHRINNLDVHIDFAVLRICVICKTEINDKAIIALPSRIHFILNEH